VRLVGSVLYLLRHIARYTQCETREKLGIQRGSASAICSQQYG